MSANGANALSRACVVPGSTTILVAPADPVRTRATLLVLSPSDKAFLWGGLIPGIGYDPAILGQDVPSFGVLPEDPADWSGAETTYADDLIETYGLAVGQSAGAVDSAVAPIGPLYVHAAGNGVTIHTVIG